MKINQYEVWISLGCTEAEQSILQPVHFNLVIHFHENIKGCVTDQLTDTVDYVSLTSLIKKISLQKPYHLIEHLCFLVHEELTKELKNKKILCDLTTNLKKVSPPVESLQSGVEFSCHSKV